MPSDARYTVAPCGCESTTSFTVGFGAAAGAGAGTGTGAGATIAATGAGGGAGAGGGRVSRSTAGAASSSIGYIIANVTPAEIATSAPPSHTQPPRVRSVADVAIPPASERRGLGPRPPRAPRALS